MTKRKPKNKSEPPVDPAIRDEAKNIQDAQADLDGWTAYLEATNNEGFEAIVRLYRVYVARIQGGEKLSAPEVREFRELGSKIEAEQKKAGPDPATEKTTLTIAQAKEVAGLSRGMFHYHKKQGHFLVDIKAGTVDRASFEVFLYSKNPKTKREVPTKGATGIPAGTSAAQDDAQADGSGPQTGESDIGIIGQKRIADLRLQVARAKRAELQFQKERGLLAAWEDIETEWARRWGIMVTAFWGFVNRLSPILEGKSRQEIEDLMAEEVWIVLHNIGKEGKYCPKVIRNNKPKKPKTPRTKKKPKGSKAKK